MCSLPKSNCARPSALGTCLQRKFRLPRDRLARVAPKQEGFRSHAGHRNRMDLNIHDLHVNARRVLVLGGCRGTQAPEAAAQYPC